jgi:peptidoglycan biosynthesis protein MviN/MurJ (putative lipid II flippase)
MFPKYSSTKPRGHEWLGWVTFILLNLGLISRIIFEPFNSISSSTFTSWMLVSAAILQWLSGVAFVANTWARVREK